MPCDDCFDIDALLTANSMLGIQSAVQVALQALCGGRCAGQLSTIGLNPISNPAGSIAEGFPDGLPDCECALLVLVDTDGALYFSPDNAVSWSKLLDSKNVITSTNPTVNDDSADGYSIGSRWINTATDKEWLCVDTTLGAAVWILVTEVPPPGFVEIVPPTVVVGTPASIDIPNIPPDYEDLILVVRGRVAGAVARTILMRFNNDSGLNYSLTAETFFGAAITYSVLSNMDSIVLVRGNNLDTDTAGFFAHMKAEIFSYANPAISRNGEYEASSFQDAANIHRAKGVLAWENLTDAISSIQLLPDTGGNWVAGTRYALYGRGTAS